MKAKQRHLVVDRTTGEAWIQAPGGKKYALDEVEAIERRAEAGDEAARAIVESLDAETLPGQMLHDCPECRAAMALGEVPDIMGPEEIAEMVEAARRDPAMRALMFDDPVLADALFGGAPRPRTSTPPRTGRPTMRRKPHRRR